MKRFFDACLMGGMVYFSMTVFEWLAPQSWKVVPFAISLPAILTAVAAYASIQWCIARFHTAKSDSPDD